MKKKKLLVSILAILLALILTLGLLSGLASVHVHAASSSEIKTEIGELKDKQKELDKQMEEISKQMSDNQSEIERIAAEKRVIDQEIGILNQQIININEQIAAYNQLIADKQEELDAAKARLAYLNEKNKERIRAMEEDGSISYWSVLFKAKNFADLLDRMNMIEEIAAADRRRLKEMSEAAAVVEQAQQELEQEKSALETTKAELAEKQRVLEEKRAEADELLAELNAKEQEFQKMMDDAEKADEDLQAEIARKEKEYNDAVAKENPSSGSNSSSSKPPSYVTDGITWIMPCKYNRFSSPYGWRIHPVYGDWRFHSGVDLGAPSGTPIYASRSGTVTTAKYHYSAGYYVTVNHGDGFSTSYLHMTHYIVGVGDKVQAGQVIGYVGSTGTSTGPHLHFTIYWNGKTVNPAEYLDF